MWKLQEQIKPKKLTKLLVSLFQSAVAVLEWILCGGLQELLKEEEVTEEEEEKKEKEKLVLKDLFYE